MRRHHHHQQRVHKKKITVRNRMKTIKSFFAFLNYFLINKWIWTSFDRRPIRRTFHLLRNHTTRCAVLHQVRGNGTPWWLLQQQFLWMPLATSAPNDRFHRQSFSFPFLIWTIDGCNKYEFILQYSMTKKIVKIGCIFGLILTGTFFVLTRTHLFHRNSFRLTWTSWTSWNLKPSC